MLHTFSVYLVRQYPFLYPFPYCPGYQVGRFVPFYLLLHNHLSSSEYIIINMIFWPHGSDHLESIYVILLKKIAIPPLDPSPLWACNISYTGIFLPCALAYTPTSSSPPPPPSSHWPLHSTIFTHPPLLPFSLHFTRSLSTLRLFLFDLSSSLPVVPSPLSSLPPSRPCPPRYCLLCPIHYIVLP